MDPRSGTLVLFRPWKDESFPIQHIYAIGIHRHGDRVPFEVATADYVEQMTAPLAVYNARILDTTPANHGVAGEYATKIKFGFKEGTIPFLINPKKLTRQFRTGLGNSKTERNVQYRWPPKCRHCESEKHLTPECPWRELELDNRKPNFHNCRHHDPGWVEPSRKPKTAVSDDAPEVLNMKPRQGKTAASKPSAGKGKEKSRTHGHVEIV